MFVCLVRIPDDSRLFDKLSSLEQVLEKCQQTELKIVHFCDFQSQYQCELFVILFRIIYPKYIHLKQVCKHLFSLSEW